MIADFPEAKREIQKIFNAVLKEKVKEHSVMLALVNKKTLHEGHTLGVSYADGKHVVTELKHFQSEFSITQEEIPTIKIDDIQDKVSELAKDMVGAIERDIFEKINDSVNESGNVISGNPGLTADSMLTALEMVSVDFQNDDRSKPIKPSLIAAPGAVENLMKSEAKRTLQEKEAHREKEEKIMDKKYEEHMKDLESRRIVD